MKKYVLCLLLAIHGLVAFSQPSKEDSLLQVLLVTKVDTSRVMLYNQLCKAVIQTHPDQGLRYARSGYAIALDAHFVRGLSLITNNIAICHSRLGNLDSAHHYYRQALEYRYQYGDKILIADVNNNIGSLYYRQGKFREALREYDIAEKTYLEAGDKKGVAGILNNKGSILKEMGSYTDALKHYMEAADVYREIGDRNKEAMVKGNIGMVYHAQKFYDEALQSFAEAEAIHRELGDLYMVVGELNSQGEVYGDKNDFTKALSYFEQARQLSVETNFKYGLATALLSMGQIHIRREDEQGPELVQQALDLYRESGFAQGEMIALHWQGRWLAGKGQFREALGPLHKSLDMAKEQESNNHLLDNYQYLSEAYAGLGRYQEAYGYHERYDALHDSIYSNESSRQIAEMQARYELAENERRIAELERQRADEALAGANRARTIWYLVGGIIIAVLVLLLILALLLVQRRHASAIERKNNEIERMNAGLESTVQERTADLLAVNRELDTFLHESTHALRRPLTRIMGLSDLLSSLDASEQDKAREYLSLINRTVHNMDAMLEKLIQVDETNHRKIQSASVDVRTLAREVFRRYEDPKVQFNMLVPEGYTLATDPYLLRVLLSNLIENAVQFPRENQQQLQVTLELIPSNFADEIRVTDNGSGIAAEILPRITEMFFRGTEHSKGNGLGLYVVRKVLQRLNGKLRVQSQKGEFTTVVVTLPRQGGSPS